MKLVFDIGANEGTLLPTWFSWGAEKVVAVEPNSACVHKLHEKFGGDPRVVIVHMAVGKAEGPVDLHICDDDSGLSSTDMSVWGKSRYARTKTWSKTEHLTQTTLDLLSETFGQPDYIKIDVEGSEQAVIKGMTAPPALLSFEFHGELKDEAAACATWLYRRGMKRFWPLKDEISFVPDYNQLWLDLDDILGWLNRLSMDSWGNIFASLPPADSLLRRKVSAPPAAILAEQSEEDHVTAAAQWTAGVGTTPLEHAIVEWTMAACSQSVPPESPVGQAKGQ